jgi:hypothetical protein
VVQDAPPNGQPNAEILADSELEKGQAFWVRSIIAGAGSAYGMAIEPMLTIRAPRASISVSHCISEHAVLPLRSLRRTVDGAGTRIACWVAWVALPRAK